MKVCKACGYPHSEAFCDNPGCVENPTVPEFMKARWREDKARREAEEAEWERIRQIRLKFK